MIYCYNNLKKIENNIPQILSQRVFIKRSIILWGIIIVFWILNWLFITSKDYERLLEYI